MSFDYDDSTGFLIGQLFIKSRLYLNSRFRTYNVTVEQWAILTRLWQEDGISQSVLAEKCNKDLPTVTRIVKILKNKALVRVLKDDEDRRTSVVYLTAEGKQLKVPMNDIAAELEGIINQTVSKHPDLHFRDMLKALGQTFD